MPNFEVFDRRSRPFFVQPLVTIQRRGIMSLNQAAYEALGNPQAVELLFDRAERVMGLRAVDQHAPHAYPLPQQGNSSNHLVAGKAFVKFYGIDTSVARRYRAEMLGNVLAVDLKQEAIETTGPRGQASRRAAGSG
jgi:ribosomal protein L17